MISGPLRWMKCTRLSAATARASSVLPVPGGPYNNTPLGARMPRRSKMRECFSGSSTISRTRATSRSRPPMSSYETAGARRFDRRGGDVLLHPGAAVAAYGAVNLNEAVVRRVRDVGARDGGRAAGDLQNVAGPRADPLEVGRREPRHRMRDVLDARFRHAKGDGCGGRRNRRLGHLLDVAGPHPRHLPPLAFARGVDSLRLLARSTITP